MFDKIHVSSAPTDRAAERHNQRSQWEKQRPEMSDSQSVGPLFNPRVRVSAVQSHCLSLIAQICNI